MSSTKNQHDASPLSSQFKSRATAEFLSSRELKFLAYVLDEEEHVLVKNNSQEYISEIFNDFRRQHLNPALRKTIPHTGHLNVFEEFRHKKCDSENNNAAHRFVRLFCMDIDSFEWVDTKNPRLCNFVWSYIRLIINDRNEMNPYTLNIKKETIIPSSTSNNGGFLHDRTLYQNLQFDTSPPNSESKKNIIINYFNFLCDTKQHKERILEKIKSKWSECSKRMDVKSWLDINNNELWTWNYLHKGINPSWFVVHDKKTDHVNGVITTFDLLNDIPDTRELLLTRMRLAWSQKAYRDKNNGKKTVSIVLSEDIINKLDFICGNTDRRKNEVVTRLIRDEYDKVKKGGH